jgi:hypothetical protein
MTSADDSRTTREYGLLEASLALRPRLQADAQRHLHHGFMQRLLMVQAGRVNLLTQADGSDRTPRGVYTATELSLQANAYYLNLRGALDNLAWSLQYQWGLLPGIGEDVGRRTSIYLFGQDFLSALQVAHSALETTLRAHSSWAQDLTNRRDPAAHRIPLQVPRSVYTEEDVLRMRDIERDAARVFESGKHSEGMAVLREIERLGAFEPRLLQATAGGPVSVDLHKQVGLDHDSFLSTAEAVVSYMSGAV